MLPKPTTAFPFAPLALLALSGCDSPTDSGVRYRVPDQTSDGWETESLLGVGMEVGPLEDLLALIESTPDHRIHSLLVVRHGKLVFEEYWPGEDLRPETLEPVERDFDRNTLHYVASVSKSITSALVGIAFREGLLESVEDSLFSFFPEHMDLRNDANAGITLEHLLTFTSGYHWNEFVYGFDDPRDSHNRMFRASDPIRHLLERPMDSQPGALFNYNSGDTNLLGEIVRRASGSVTLLAFAQEELFDPLGIEHFSSVRFGSAPEVIFASGGFSLRPRDMAKLGLLFLNRGAWNGQHIVPDSWVDASTRVSVPLPGNSRTYGYGYNWWLGSLAYATGRVDYFQAAGWGGQYIFGFPQLDLVVVFTQGGYYDTRPLSVGDLMEDFILASVSPSGGELAAIYFR